MKLRQLNLVLLTLALAGCSLLGPDYSRPDVNAPASWNSLNSGNASESANISDTAWWKQFNDPMLNDMIDQALKNNNNIQVAIGNISQAQAQLEKAHMAWVPTISFGGGGAIGQSFNQSISPSNSAFNNFSTTNSQDFNAAFAGFVPSYSLNVFQIIKSEDMAKLNVKMQQASKNAVRLTVISQVAGGYFQLLGLQKQLALQEQMLADSKEMRKYATVKQANGTATEMNVRGMDQFIATLNAQIPAIQDNIVQTQNALQVLMNKNPASIMTNSNFDNVKTDGIIPINLPSAVLENRPDIMAAEYQLEVSNAKIGFSKSAFFPSINLTTPIGASTFALSNLFSGSSDFWMTQLVATVPVLNLGTLADIKQSKASYYSAYYNYIQTVRSAFSQVDNGLSKHQSANNVYLQQQEGLNAANDLYKLNQVTLNNGSTSYADTLNFKLNIDYSKLNLNNAKVNQLNSIVNMYQVLGGGYNVENTESVNKFNDVHDI